MNVTPFQVRCDLKKRYRCKSGGWMKKKEEEQGKTQTIIISSTQV
jgi:hypothetical protein